VSGVQAEPLAEHERFMARALELAERGRGRTTPNPMVGCVVVRDDEVVGEGWHERAGEPHAEANALEAAGENARGATVYVTLEPCNHHGRTPPCTNALIEAGVRRVVIAARDPNPKAAGGLERLQEAGIEVVVGVLQDEAEGQNEVFRTVHLKERPFVLYKTAMTLDGKIATRSGQSRWITGETSRNLVQAWRNELDAIAVGVNTVLLDDPLLTCRLEGGRTPLKIVFDSVARTPVEAKLFAEDERGEPARVIIFVTERAAKARVQALREHGAEVVHVPEVRGRTDVSAALNFLKAQDVSSLLLEGGGTLAWAFFEHQAVDRVAVFIGPKLLGGGGASPLGGLGIPRMEDAIELDDLRTEFVAQDLLVTGRARYTAARGHHEAQTQLHEEATR
jgi:diaminohydroxyphosphoribosylaminopyrimidine deaminase/5-amino-6-(5-phosphoribosylamino)uracil reductase